MNNYVIITFAVLAAGFAVYHFEDIAYLVWCEYNRVKASLKKTFQTLPKE
jgi:hypothetical protein